MKTPIDPDLSIGPSSKTTEESTSTLVSEALRAGWEQWRDYIKPEDRRVALGSFIAGATEALHAVGVTDADGVLASMATNFFAFKEVFSNPGSR